MSDIKITLEIPKEILIEIIKELVKNDKIKNYWEKYLKKEY